LLRSCYSTTARFFKDDTTVELPIQWYFTDPGAEWIGKQNVFNARTWYGDDPSQWPLLGEVQGAPRTWVDGAVPCVSSLGPFGSDDQWDHGALLSDALVDDPCKGPIVQPFGENGFFVEEAGGGLPGVRDTPDRWYAQSAAFATSFYTLTRSSAGAGCCFASQGTLDITDGPPAFNSQGFGPFGIIPGVGDCFELHYVGDTWPIVDFRVACS
jgi:hypothetical protein